MIPLATEQITHMIKIDLPKLKSLSEKHNIISSIINGKSCQYLDIPRYPNIGDHLIAHGCFHFFESSGIQLSRASDIFSYQQKWLSETDVIVFSGGGNFGTLWPDIHKRRLLLAREALELGKTVIILPQSIYYENTLQIKEDKEILGSFPNFYFFARDTYSYNISQGMFEHIYLAPDMAHQLYNLFNKYAPLPPQDDSRLYFMRKDKEASNDRFTKITNDGTIVDWDDLLKINNCAKPFNTYNALYKKLRCFQFDKNLTYWRRTSWKIIETAVNFFLKYDSVITDRLHGMILSLLLNRKVHMIDNNNHKLSNYAKTWLLN